MRLSVDCDLDAEGVRAIRSKVESAARESGDLVLDLAGVVKLDSSGVGLLVFVQKRKRELGYRFGIRNVTGQPRELLQRFGLLALLEWQEPEVQLGIYRRAVGGLLGRVGSAGRT